MSESTDAPTTDTIAAQPAETPDTGADLAAEAEKWKALARKHEERAKANAKAAQELEDLRKQSMTEQERAVAQARQEAAREVRAQYGGRLVEESFRAAFAGKLGDEQVEAFLEDLDLTRYLTEDGEVDKDRIALKAGMFAPKRADAPAFDADQGQRSAPLPLNGDPLLRDLKAKLGIS